tara:strand:- start:2430 stop:4520 length:2091 start_codon:yes stop_codon:yes gene_type:complete
MAGYTRQSAAQIISGEVISASPINAEYNQLLAAFNSSTGHKHDGTAAEGPPIALIADADLKNKIVIDTSNNELEFYVEQGGVAEQQLSIKHEIIEPTTDNNIDLGSSTKVFRNAYVNAINVGATGGTFASVDINGGTIDGTVIGGSVAANVTGDTITANQFSGPISGAVTGNVSGDVTGDVTGNLTGNVTASVGSSQFNDVVISGNLNMDAGTTSTITNLSAPSGANDAATKDYVDTSIASLVDAAPGDLDTLNELAAALNDQANFGSTVVSSIAAKLPLAGGTMTGNITMSQSGGTTTVTGLPTPSAGSDAANKTYADTKLPSASPTVASGPLTLSGAPTQNLHAATKLYVDTVAGSNQQAATSAAAAANSASDAQKLAINPENSQFTLADGVTTGFSALHHAAKAEDSATAAAASFDSFDDIYLGPKSSAPSTDNDGDALQTGALYFDTTAGKMFVYDGSSFVVTGSAVNGTSSRQVYVATSGQTTFAIAHDVGFVDVYINGLKLRTGTDFTDNNVSNIVLASGANAGDIVDIVAFGAFNVANVYNQTQSDARYTRIANNLSELSGSASTARANIGAAPTDSPTFIGTVTIPTSGLNYSGTTVTATGAELNHVSGVTSAIQTQIDTKADITGHVANLSAGASGSIPYQTGSNTTTFRTIGSTGQVLTVAGGVPTWAEPAASGTSNAKAYFFGAM